jgi:hypothetical protein
MAGEQFMCAVVLEALKLIMTGGIGAAVVGCIGMWFVNKKLDAQKREHDRQLESLRSELGRKSTVHKLQFEKEFHLYGELWRALVDVRSTVTITPTVDVSENQARCDVYKSRLEKAGKALSEANDLFRYHRPFYHDNVSKIAGNLLDQCHGYIRQTARFWDYGTAPDKLFDSADKSFKEVTEAINKIEEAIKRRIGLLQEAEIVE